MDNLSYFQSITMEMTALKNRVRHFIKDRNWLSDGLWKESVLRAVLRRHLPQSLGVGCGFIVTNDNVSTQIDILIYDRNKPILFQDGDFVVITPDLVHAIIEVKTKITPHQLKNHLNKLAEIHHLAASTALCHPFIGLFSYENGGCNYNNVLAALQKTVKNISRRNIHCISLGDDLFTKFWYCPPETPRAPNALWRAYNLAGTAPAYFIHNIIESLCERSIIDNNSIWYPKQGKECHTLGEISMTST